MFFIGKRTSILLICGLVLNMLWVIVGTHPHAISVTIAEQNVTPSASLSITPSPLPTLTPTYPFQGTYTPPAQTPVYTIPPAVPMLAVNNDAIENVLLLGSDSADNFYRRTDVMILVSINKEAGTVALWHIPRALFVYVPNHNLSRINTVYAQSAVSSDFGGGFGLLKETFRYNFGIEVDHYARVNFTGFMKIIELLGGLELSVDCAIQDWRIKQPGLDPTEEDNWEIYTLPVGRWKFKPDTALWYVRSRQSTSDFDRGRRQMDLLRAMWQQIRTMGLLTQIEELWPTLLAIVETDMGFTDVLPLIPLATELDMSQMARYGGTMGTHYIRTFTPDNGREVLLPNREFLIPMLENFLTPPTANRLGRGQVSVEIADASRYDIGLEYVAADRLAWEGFLVHPLEEWADIQRDMTVIYDYTGQTKGSPLPDFQRVLRVSDEFVIRQPDPNRTVDFRVEIGQEYRLCTYGYAEDEIDLEAANADETTTPEGNLSGLSSAVCWLRFRAEVNVRSGPSLDDAIMDFVTPNDHLPVTGRTVDGQWWRVNVDGTTGWVSARITAVDILGDCTNVSPVVLP